MAQIPSNYNAEEHEPLSSFEPIPAGEYLAIIEASENKQTKNGRGSYLELKFQIIEGEHKGRNLWSRLNLENPNEKAVEIALRELGTICRAVKVMQPKDSVELHNLPLIIVVKVSKRADNDQLTNEIAGYLSKEEGSNQAKEGNTESSAKNDSAPWKE